MVILMDEILPTPIVRPALGMTSSLFLDHRGYRMFNGELFYIAGYFFERRQLEIP